MINIISVLVKPIKAGWQHYKNMKAIGDHCTGIQGKEAIKRMECMNEVSKYAPVGISFVLYDLCDFAIENGISKEEIIETMLKTGLGAEHVITALDWMVYVSVHSPLTISDMIAYNLYRVAYLRKEDVISYACMGYDAETIIKLLKKPDNISNYF